VSRELVTGRANGAPPLRVAIVAAEAWPYAKAGGLADVTSALAAELRAHGVDAFLVLPGYGSVERQRFALQPVGLPVPLSVPIGQRQEPVAVLAGRLPDTGVPLLTIQHPGYFDRPGIYFDPRTGVEFGDAAERFAYFSRASVRALAALGRIPDVLHLNDYHTALAAAYARVDPSVEAQFERTACVFSIHNLGYQGLFGAEVFGRLGLPAAFAAPLGPLEFWGRLDFMKLGLVLADVLTTVSPTYAHEIQESQEHGLGLEGVLAERSERLFGILNGIDTRIWDPATDPHIPARYSAADPSGKRLCKRALQERLGLPVDADVPLFGMISRLTSQKGFDVLFAAMPALLGKRMQIVILGTGQREYEQRFEDLAARQPNRIAVRTLFDDDLAHGIEAGCDFFLMPSRYEPCGLNQMYSLRYGTIPVVRATGGLADTVRDWDDRTQRGTGFVYGPHAADALLGAIDRALDAFSRPETLRRLIDNAMHEDFSWSRSARRYEEIYRLAIARRMTTPLPAVLEGRPERREGH
jgi:starch synthase